jgi:enediyne biosynthesis protein E2
MSTTLGALRRLLMAPDLADTTFQHRGFPGIPTAATRRLEAVPQAVVCGFEWGIEVRGQWELARRLDLVDRELRGFAYEGATMACTILDVMGPRRGNRTRDLLRGPGEPHLFLAYIGIGFAMARLPRRLWRTVVPDLGGPPYHPTMSWLAVDGYAFDRAYFDTDRWVGRQERLPAYPWQGRADYFARAADQGIGRALWFVHGGRAGEVATAVARFAPERHGDLWSGVGLAATFAGGCGPDGFDLLRRMAGDCAADLAQGAAFAAKARSHARYVPEHSEVAMAALGGCSVAAAAALTDDAVVPPTDTLGRVPSYELWRRNVRARLVATADSRRS